MFVKSWENMLCPMKLIFFIILMPIVLAVSSSSEESIGHKYLDQTLIQQDLLRSPKSCSSTNLLLILVHSKPDHFQLRDVLRTTWAGFHSSFKPVFLVGLMDEDDPGETEDAVINSKVVHESDAHGDIALINMRDSYHNLTLKHAVGHRWALEHCPGAKFLLKTDDDVFVDTIHILDFLGNFGFDETSEFILCHVIQDQEPVRDKDGVNGKWFLSRDEYPEDLFPPYCSGSAYVASITAIHAISGVTLEIPYLFVDDVFMTGLARERREGIDLYDWSGSFLIKHMDDEERLLDPESGFYSPLLMVAFDIKAEDIRVLFEKAQMCLKHQGRCYGALYRDQAVKDKHSPPKVNRTPKESVATRTEL